MADKAKEQEMVGKLRKALKNEPVARLLCDRYGKGPEFIDTVPIEFKPLDVSAKTVNGRVYLNSKLLDEEFRDNVRYILHELTHCLQQEAGDVEGSSKDDYLDDPNEVEAFKAQIDYMDEAYDPEEVQEYLEHLMDHHDVKGKERQRKIEELAK